MTMMKSTFSLFQRVIKHLFSNALYLTQSHFSVSPKRFDTVHMRWIIGKFIPPMLNPKMPGIAHIDQAMITTPAIRMKDTIQAYLPRITFCSVRLRTSGTLSVETQPWRLKRPNTMVLLPAPRPLLPRMRFGPK